MTPQDAVNRLIAAGWSESRIAREVEASQPTIHRIKHGKQRRGASFDTCTALIRLADTVPAGEPANARAPAATAGNS
jgi:hypothetical protein